MERKLTIYFTSDNHGYLSAVDYATGKPVRAGVANCIPNFHKDGNSLIIDGGDSIQGSPLTYYLHKKGMDDLAIPAKIMNFGGYQFLTLGNHDFNYGKRCLENYLETLDARCLCANVEGVRGVEKTAVITLANGLRVGLTGIVTHFVNIWERPENLIGITVREPIPCARAALEELRSKRVDVTVCIYHGGFENDLDTGVLLSTTEENQGYRICRELDFDVLLTGHQHIPVENRKIFNTYVCQTPDKARKYARMVVSVQESGEISAESRLVLASEETDARSAAILEPLERELAHWLDTPMGHLDTALEPAEPLVMAEHGSDIANFFNQVQLEASGAELSCTSLANEVKGFARDVTIRDIVATYVYPNTLEVLQVNRNVLKQALERCAEYFHRNELGALEVSEVFLKPKVEHYNYDFFSGIHVVMDVRRPVGDRVISIQYGDQELPEEQELTLCMNNYRSSGTGGYECYLSCRKVKVMTTEVAELIMDYVMNHEKIRVDRTKWLDVLY